MSIKPLLAFGCLACLIAPVLGGARALAQATDPRLPAAAPSPRGLSNDQCTNPQQVSGPVVTLNFNTAQATTGPQGQNNPLCLLFGTAGIANDEWFRWVATGTGTANLQSCGMTNIDTKAAVYNGTTCPAAPAIACGDDECPGTNQTNISFPVTAGQSYMIQIGRFPGSPLNGSGTFVLTGPSSGPPNDNCGTAQQIGNGQFPFTNVGATTDNIVGCANIASDVWFRYQAPGTGQISVSTCGNTNFDTVLNAYRAPCASPTLLACNNNFCNEQSTIFFNVIAGQQYLIRVGGFGGVTGSGTIVIQPIGPTCIQSCSPGATPEGEPCGADTNGGCDSNPPRFEDVECNATFCGSLWADQGARDRDWYRFTVNQSTRVNVILTAELPVVVNLVQIQGSCGNLLAVAAAEALPCGFAIINQIVNPGTYLVVVAPGSLEGPPILEGFPCGSRNAYALSIGFGTPCPTNARFFAGLNHTSLGVAQLIPGSLIITNTGATGTSGASVAVGLTAEGWRADGELPPGPLPTGASLVAAPLGNVMGTPSMTLGLARIDAIGPPAHLRLTPDFTPISAVTYRLQAFLGTTQVFSQAGRSGAAFDRANDGLVRLMTFSCIPAPCAVPPCPQTGPFVPVFECRFPGSATFTIVAGPTVIADRFLMTPESPDAPITSVSEIGITAANTGDVTLNAEAIVFRRLFHVAHGDAHFNASGGNLGLNSMDNLNTDGVTIELDPSIQHFTAQLASLGNPADPTNPIPDGAFIDYIARGIVDGIPESNYSRSHYEDVGDHLRVSFDFSFTGTTQLQVVYEDPPNVEMEILAGSMQTFEVTGDWVLTLEKTYDSCGRVICQRPCWVPAAGVQSPSGQSFSAQNLEVLTVNATHTFGGYTSADILFSSIPAATIVNESVELVGTCCPCDYDDSGGVGSQDFFNFMTCFFGGACPPKRSADFNGDGIINSNDFFSFITCFFAPPGGCS